MDVELITIGDELLLGFTIDTNAAHLAREVSELGVRVVRRATVGDEAEDIAAAVREALDRTGAVITTGGLGPTADDLTKPAIAQLFGRELYADEELWEGLRRMWRERGRGGEPPAANRSQIMIPAGARVLHNRHGSAPGIFLNDDRGRWVAMLPGVPREMRGMLADEIIPLLRARVGESPNVIRSRTLRATGIAESQLPSLLNEYSRGIDGLSLAYLPGQEGVDLRLTARGLNAADADVALDGAMLKLRERVDRYVYADGGTDLADVVLGLCRGQGMRIAVGESCTGGLLGARLTAIPGSSDVVLGGVIAYDNAIKEKLLGVSRVMIEEHGAVSEVVASAMASGACERLGAEVGVGITGVAGPGGGTVEKPVGLVWIAVAVRGEVTTYGGRFIGDRPEIRFRATQTALDMVRRALTP